MSVFGDVVKTVTDTARKAGDGGYDKEKLKKEAEQRAAEISLPENIKSDRRYNELKGGRSDAGMNEKPANNSISGKADGKSSTGVSTAIADVYSRTAEKKKQEEQESSESADESAEQSGEDGGYGNQSGLIPSIVAALTQSHAMETRDSFLDWLFKPADEDKKSAPQWVENSGLSRDEYEKLRNDERSQAALDKDRQSIYEDMYADSIQKDDLRLDRDTLENAIDNDPRFQAISDGRSDMGAAAVTARPEDIASGLDVISFKDDEDKRQHLARKYDKDPSEITDDQLRSVESKIDDGSLERGNLTAPDMTGAQYINYVNSGLGGRPVEDIDPHAVYNKIDEHDNYGFTYYSPDWQTELGMRIDHEIGMVPKGVSALADLRPQNFMKSVDGIEFDSRNFADEFAKWSDDKLSKALNAADKSDDTLVYAQDADEETIANSVPMVFDEISVTTEDGQEHKFSASSYSILPVNYDGTITVVLDDPDSTTITFNDADDLMENFNPGQMHIASEGQQPFAYLPVDGGMEINGTYLTPSQAMKVRSGNYTADYGPMNILKPRTETKEFWDADRSGGDVLSLDNFDFTDIAPQFVDIAFGSSPYFNPSTAWPLAVANAYQASKGIDTMTINPDGSSYLVAENISPDVYKANILGNAVMPATEYGLGNIGRQVVKPFSNMTTPLAPTLQLATGVVGEGLEEIPANIIDQLKIQGTENLYANDLTDEYGNVLLDSTGHPLYDSNTSFYDRARNFAMDAPNAFIGGALLGGAFGLREVPTAVANTRRAIEERKISRSPRPKLIDPNEIQKKG